MSLSSQYETSERSLFKRSLIRLEQDVLRMGALVEESFQMSHQALFSQQLEVVPQIKAKDKEIDQYYRQIEQDCARFMTLQAPVAQDLRILSAFMQLVRDLERIGDYAKDQAELALRLVLYDQLDCISDIEEMSNHAQRMLATSLVALTELDASAGETVKQLDDVVDDAYDSIFETLAQQQNIPGVIEPYLILVLIIRYLERMADHATNIAQRVSYIVRGYRA